MIPVFAHMKYVLHEFTAFNLFTTFLFNSRVKLLMFVLWKTMAEAQVALVLRLQKNQGLLQLILLLVAHVPVLVPALDLVPFHRDHVQVLLSMTLETVPDLEAPNRDRVLPLVPHLVLTILLAVLDRVLVPTQDLDHVDQVKFQSYHHTKC